MNDSRLADQAKALRHHIERLSGADVELIRDSGSGRQSSPLNPGLRRAWSPGPAWKARVELGRLRREIDLLLLHCSGE